MKTTYAFALAAAQLAAAHSTFQSFVIDGKDQGQHFAVRTPSNGNNPIYDVTSTAMICNGGQAAPDTLEVAAGSSLTFQWHHEDPAQNGGDEPIAASHKGPILAYIAPAESNGEGDVWVKIYEDGLTDGKWAVDKFIANKGQVTITLPDLAAGEYLIRPELIALHEGNRAGGAQFYNGCGQIKITGSGTATLPAGIDMTKAYTPTDPGVLANIYGMTSYEIPGPKVWDGASSGSAPVTPAKPVSPAPTPSPAAETEAEATPVATKPEATKPETPVSSPSAPAANPGTGSGSSTLPEEFTLQEFIAWLKQATGSSKTRRHARSFFG